MPFDFTMSQQQSSGLDQELLDNGIIFHFGPLDDPAAEKIVKALWLLETRYVRDLREKKAAKEPVEEGYGLSTFGLNTAGGTGYALRAITNAIRCISYPLMIVGTGCVASAGAWVIASGKRGYRVAYEDCRFLLHEPKFTNQTELSSEETTQEAKEIAALKEISVQSLACWTGKSVKTIRRAITGQNWFGAEEAKRLGLIDKIWKV